LEARTTTLGLRKRVRFLGMVPDPLPVLQAADVFAMPSREEASPMALLEAMACARAVVATAVGGILEIVVDDRSGRLGPPGRSEGVAGGVRRLGYETGLRGRLGTGRPHAHPRALRPRPHGGRACGPLPHAGRTRRIASESVDMSARRPLCIAFIARRTVEIYYEVVERRARRATAAEQGA